MFKEVWSFFSYDLFKIKLNPHDDLWNQMLLALKYLIGQWDLKLLNACGKHWLRQTLKNNCISMHRLWQTRLSVSCTISNFKCVLFGYNCFFSYFRLSPSSQQLRTVAWYYFISLITCNFASWLVLIGCFLVSLKSYGSLYVLHSVY